MQMFWLQMEMKCKINYLKVLFWDNFLMGLPDQGVQMYCWSSLSKKKQSVQIFRNVLHMEAS